MRAHLLLSLFLLGLCCPLRSAAQQPGNGPAQTNSLQAELAAATTQVEKIINQPVTAHMRTASMQVGTYPGWFHPGATKPAFDTVDVRTTQETPYDKFAYVCSDTNPRMVFVGRELEFNSMTKYFYKDRTVPKKKLTEAEMVEVNRLYRIIGRCQRQLAQSQDPQSTSDNPESTPEIVQVTRRLNPYTGGAIILALVLLLWLISKRRT